MMKIHRHIRTPEQTRIEQDVFAQKIQDDIDDQNGCLRVSAAQLKLAEKQEIRQAERARPRNYNFIKTEILILDILAKHKHGLTNRKIWAHLKKKRANIELRSIRNTVGALKRNGRVVEVGHSAGQKVWVAVWCA